MPIEKVFAHISCSNLQSSIAWFTQLFGRAPDESPMEGLAEWHQNNQAGFQLFQDPKNAGHATMTLGVSDLDSERSRLAELKLQPAYRRGRLREHCANSRPGSESDCTRCKAQVARG
jgi:hypothetical protein